MILTTTGYYDALPSKEGLHDAVGTNVRMILQHFLFHFVQLGLKENKNNNNKTLELQSLASHRTCEYDDLQNLL